MKAFLEAEAYDGPSLIIAYSHCIAHGYDLAYGLEQQKAAVNPATGRCSATTPTWWRRTRTRSSSIRAPPSIPLKDYIYNETRYTMLVKSNPEAGQAAAGTGPGRRGQPLEALRLHGS